MIVDAESPYACGQAVAIDFALIAKQIGMRCAEHDIKSRRARSDDLGHGVDNGLDALARRQQAEREDDRSPLEAELLLGARGLEKREIRNPVRNDVDVMRGDAMARVEELPSFLRHHHQLRRTLDDSRHHIALARIWVRKDSMKRRDDRHIEA